MLVVLDLLEPGQAVEVVEQSQLRLLLAGLSGLAEVLDQHPRVDLLLDVDRRRIDLEIL